MKPFPIDNEVLGPGEQDGLLGGAEPFLPGEVPACWPVRSWSGFLLLSLNQDRGSPLVLHMGDASLQQDLLPLPSCQVKEIAFLLLPLLSDDLKKLTAVVGGNSNGVGRKFP